MSRGRVWLGVVLLVAMVATACGSDDSGTGATTTGGDGGSTTATTAVELTDSFRGVTATDIKLGVAYVDFECIAAFIDFNQGDTEKVTNALVADINANGGVLGRKLTVVFKKLCPLNPDDVSAACTGFTDDDQVFAVIGVYDTPPSDGSNQLCLTRDHQTILINELVTKAIMDQAPPGLLIQPGILPERRLEAMLSLLKQEGTIDGRKVAVLGDQDTAANAEAALQAAGLDVETGSTAELSITSEDTSAAQAQLDSFIEKWRTEGVDTVIMAGLLVSAKQFVEKLKAAMPDVQLLSDDSSVGSQAQDEVRAGLTPNPYEGMLTLSGLNETETFESDGVQRCVGVYEKATGETVVAPADVVAGPDGKKVQLYVNVQDRCNELGLFVQIAEKAGADLTNDSWIAAVNAFGTIDLPTSPYASLGDGKYDADDAFRLGTWDSTIGEDGDFKPLTDLLDVTA